MASPKLQSLDLGEVELVLTKDDQVEKDKSTEKDESTEEDELTEEDKRRMRRRRRRARRWASRTEAMAYGRIGSSKLNELMQERLIIAKKNGVKVLVDLDSMDDYYDALPDVADTEVTAAEGR